MNVALGKALPTRTVLLLRFSLSRDVNAGRVIIATEHAAFKTTTYPPITCSEGALYFHSRAQIWDSFALGPAADDLCMIALPRRSRTGEY